VRRSHTNRPALQATQKTGLNYPRGGAAVPYRCAMQPEMLSRREPRPLANGFSKRSATSFKKPAPPGRMFGKPAKLKEIHGTQGGTCL
jgi:hypothetical protein